MDPFRSPLLRTSRLISLPPGTEMFQFPGFASPLREMTSLATCRVSPFGHLGIIACVPLPRAFRSLPRPSSPPCAQASPTCLRPLDYITHRQAEHALQVSCNSQPSTRMRRCLDSHPTIYLAFTFQTAMARIFRSRRALNPNRSLSHLSSPTHVPRSVSNNAKGSE